MDTNTRRILCDQGQPVGEGFVARDMDGNEWILTCWDADADAIEAISHNGRDIYRTFNAAALGLYWR